MSDVYNLTEARLVAELAALGRGDHPMTARPVAVHDLLGGSVADSTVTIRVKPEMIAKADRLAARVTEDPLFGAVAPGDGVSRSGLFRLALALGLEELERRYPDRGGDRE